MSIAGRSCRYTPCSDLYLNTFSSASHVPMSYLIGKRPEMQEEKGNFEKNRRAEKKREKNKKLLENCNEIFYNSIS